MLMIMNSMMMIIMISLMFMMISFLISKKMNKDREKKSPFECGFDPMNTSRIPFSIHFFLIAMIFLIFDIEITLMFPLILMMKLTNPMMLMMLTSMFLLILLMGLYHEWKQEALSWSK
uniref:NADH-ubiquinone oxidoreductase chain 3 n=1 Tax=Stenocladius sp. FM17 TaxID=2596692 RepID=A0A5C0PW86_9COLE|nr:NADH dehydrogenase subunit 3 [Stenocladius sp. FM17]